MSSYSEKMLTALRNEDLTEANLMFEEALKKDDPEILASLAGELQAIGFLDEAKRILANLSVDFPEEDVFNLSLAEIAIENDDIDSAFEYLERIQPESENYLESLLVTADLYQVLGIPEVSEAKLLQAKTIAPEEPLITFALAELHFTANQLGEAINDYSQLQKEGIDEIANISIREEFAYLDYAPILFVSAMTKQRLNKIPAIIEEVSMNQNLRIPSSVLNDIIMDAVAINPTPTDKGKRLKIFYATQVAVKPPTFVVFVNEEELMHFSYARFLENQIRKAFEFEGTPIKIIPRRRK